MKNSEVENAKVIASEFFKQGAASVYLAKTENRFYIGLTPATRVRGTQNEPKNIEVTSVEAIAAAFEELS